MVYAPTVGRLECGFFPSDPYGFWQENGFGLLSIFKVDWERFGGGYLILRALVLVNHFITRCNGLHSGVGGQGRCRTVAR